MNAKEMFEKLNYKQGESRGKWLRFVEEREFRRNVLSFNLQYKTYSTNATDEFGDPVYMGITPEMHSAITQQLHELGWLK